MAGVQYREIRPCAQLRRFVDSFWILDHDGAPDAQRVVPDGHAELIFNLGEPFAHLHEGRWHRQPRAFFAGQIDGPLILRPNGRAQILGVRFTPHGAAAALAPPMHELAGRFTSIGDFSPALDRAFDRALDGREPVAAVESTLLRTLDLRRADPIAAAAVQRLAESRGAASLANLAADLNLSNRQFERRFRAAVGLAPATFRSLQRFVQVFRVIGDEAPRWVETALACGYYDQAHLIRDFKRFTGETPAALLSDDADLARHFLTRFVAHASACRVETDLDAT
jgi:AraC-like DNA-binding protein